MHLFYKRKYYKYLAIILFFLCIITRSLSSPLLERSEASSGYIGGLWVEGITNNNQRTFRIDDDYIIQQGTHNAANDGVIRYRTIDYRLSRQKYNLSEKFNSGSNAGIKNEPLSVSKSSGTTVGTVKTVEYTIKSSEFIYAAAQLGITGEYINQNNGASIYMHNVFESYLNDATRKTPLNDKVSFLAAEAWSENTRNIIDSYYNYEFKLTPNATYTVKVVAVDTDKKILNNAKNKNNATVPNPLLLKEVIYGESLAYELSNPNRELKHNNNDYKYKRWYYEYTPRNSSKKTSMEQRNHRYL